MINDLFQPAAEVIQTVVFFPISFSESVQMPIVVLLLLCAALIFTVQFRFIGVRLFGLAINIVRGKYDELEGERSQEQVAVHTVDGDLVDTIKREDLQGEVSHFQALTAALSGTVGLGNIAGVAIAITLGGPGATFWMIMAGLLGMASKFVECTLGVCYRDVDESGTVYGGPMYYLSKGLKSKGLGKLGKLFSIFFAIMCIGGSFGGGNMFQANQAAVQFNAILGFEHGAAGTIFGIFLAILIAIIIIGGIKRIGAVTEKVVPFMCGIYVLSALIIILLNIHLIPTAFATIFNGAFSPEGITGGFVGVLVIGFRRGAFSNEAGVGSAAIAHSAVKTKYPASEGIVALLEPFIDTVIVCTMTALVIIITGNHTTDGSIGGVDLTSHAFGSVLPWFPYVLMVAVVLFAISTMLSWSYYGLQSWMFLFGKSPASRYLYKVLFCLAIVLGSSVSLTAVKQFSDAMVFAMAVPNLIGLFILLPRVKLELKRYLEAIQTT